MVEVTWTRGAVAAEGRAGRIAGVSGIDWWDTPLTVGLSRRFFVWEEGSAMEQPELGAILTDRNAPDPAACRRMRRAVL